MDNIGTLILLVAAILAIAGAVAGAVNYLFKKRPLTILSVILVIVVGFSLLVLSTISAEEAFQRGRVYTYKFLLGHSIATAKTGSDVNVLLVSLDLSVPSAGSKLQVSFQDYDTRLGADFGFEQLTNVYMVDDSGARYPATGATPSELLLAPGHGGDVIVRFPLIGSAVHSLELYFNTDYGALDVPCVTLTPHEVLRECHGTLLAR
jgi:hypothetical protein